MPLRRRLKILFTLILFISNGTLFIAQAETPPRLVARGGGSIDGIAFTNSLEALNRSYRRGARFMEIDLAWTSDNELVLIRDWEKTNEKLFGRKEIPTLKEFKRQKILAKYTPLGFSDLARWLMERQDAFIVTDVRTKNIDALRLISRRFPKIQKKIIPQIYEFEEYEPILKLGYKKIIFSLSRLPKEKVDLLKEFVKKTTLFAATMPAKMALRSTVSHYLQKDGVFVYVYAEKDAEFRTDFESVGVRGYYVHNPDNLKQ